MLYYISENKIKKLYSKTRKIMAFSFDRAQKSITIAAKNDRLKDDVLQIRSAAALMPSKDLISAVVRGDMSVKKGIKKATKYILNELKRPKITEENMGLKMTMHIILTTIRSASKDNAVAVTFIRPTDDNDVGTRRLAKFFEGYLKNIFDAFGITIETKLNKKMLKGKRKEIIARMVKKMIEQEMSEDGRIVYRLNAALLHSEIQDHYFSRINPKDGIVFKKAFIKRLIDTASGAQWHNFSQNVTLKKKTAKKFEKAIVKRSKLAIKYYNEYRKMVLEITKASDNMKTVKMPKGKYGDVKIKDFTKFCSKKKNLGFIAGVYAHIASRLEGQQVGDKYYNNDMRDAHMLSSYDNFGKVFAMYTSSLAKERAAREKELTKAENN